MMPYFSVVIPTYNRADIISATILSVIKQSHIDWELIIIDDGGSDNTKDVVNSFKDSRIKYFWKSNGERGAARNFGTQKAKGDYVFFLDSDDILYPTHLQHAFKKINELDHPEFFHSRYEELFEDKKVQVDKLDQDNIWDRIKKQNKIGCPFFLRHDIGLLYPFSENRELKIGEDWLIVLKVGLKFKLNISNEVTMGVVQHDNRSMKLLDYKDVLKSRDLIIEELEAEDNTSKIIKNVYFELTSLANLSAVIQAQKKVAAIETFKLFFKYPIRVCSQKRTLAIIKYLLFK
jgi:glycosyltransferase involved in cell wall biosynthesis